MAKLTLNDISEAMRDIDICMMTTRADNSTLDGRPMSNNRQVEYQGDSYFFAHASAPVVKEIDMEPQVNLSYIGKNQLYISVSGIGSIIRDKKQMAQHWVPDLDQWFEDGINTPDLAMIKVKATRIKYWNKMEEGEVKV